jgi:hypothetical protein
MLAHSTDGAAKPRWFSSTSWVLNLGVKWLPENLSIEVDYLEARLEARASSSMVRASCQHRSAERGDF